MKMMFLVCALLVFSLFSCEMPEDEIAYNNGCDSANGSTDVTPPTPTGTVDASHNLPDNTITVSWTAATDDVSSLENLRYRVYYSTTQGLDTNTIESSGTPVGEYVSNITTSTIGPLAGGVYFLYVLVIDESCNKNYYYTDTFLNVPLGK